MKRRPRARYRRTLPRSHQKLLALRYWVFAILVTVLWTPLAFADDFADEAELHFELGAEAYKAGDFRGAVEHFSISNRLSPNANVTHNIARAYDKLGRYPEAYRNYQQALISVTQADAKLQIEQALLALEEWVVTIDVETVPAGATIYVDRVELGSRGEAPRRFGLAPGTYRIIARKAGFRQAEIQLEPLNAGQSKAVVLDLLPLLGRIAVSGANVQGATVSVDVNGLPRQCSAPCTLDVPPGMTVIAVTRPGFRSVETVVDVLPEHTHKVVTKLEPSTGIVSVEADETGALVEVDDRATGFTPALLRLPVGKHKVRVTYPGSDPVERELEVSEEAPQRLSLALTRSDQVVAASRRMERAEDAPSSVTVIPGEEIRLFSYPTVAEALRGSPGVFQWDDRAYPGVGIRGQGRLGSYGNRVLVLQDDHAMNDSWAGSSYPGYQLRTDLASVERIEVVRGPGSVLYGTNAFAGVINVVTRDAAEKTTSEVGVGVAQEGVGRLRARQDVRIGPETAFWAGVGLAKSAGNSYVLDVPGGQLTTDPAADAMEGGTAEAHFQHKALSVVAMTTTEEKAVPHGYFETIVGDPRSRQRDTRGYMEVRLEPKLGPRLTSLSRISGDAYLYKGAFPRAPGDDGGVEYDTFEGYWIGAEQRVRYAATDQLAVTLGGLGQFHPTADQLVVDDNHPADDGPWLDERRQVYVGAGYGMLDFVLPRLRISAGVRFDAYGTSPRECGTTCSGTFGSSWNPRTAAVIKPYEAGTSKLVLGKAFRAPSTYELFYNDGTTQEASPELGPEEVWALDLEHLHRFSKAWQGGVSFYLTRTTGIIVGEGEATEADPLHYVNSTAPLATTGAELRLRREWAQGWMFEVSYSLQLAAYLSSEDLGALLTFDKSPLYRDVANVPGHMAAVKGAVPILRKALTLGTRLTFESGRSTHQEAVSSEQAQSQSGAYFVWDIVLRGEEKNMGLTYAFGVYNAFDSKYALPVGEDVPTDTFPGQGRTFMGDLGLKF
jgi:outer membrane receptor protein involved in Fe transport